MKESEIYKLCWLGKPPTESTELKKLTSGPHECDYSCHMNKPSIALIASDGKRSVIMDSVGGYIDYWMSEACVYDEFDGLEAGVWLWEGTIVGSTDYWGEYDEELAGEFRKLTKEDWDLLQGGDVLWDSSEWETCVKGGEGG